MHDTAGDKKSAVAPVAHDEFSLPAGRGEKSITVWNEQPLADKVTSWKRK